MTPEELAAIRELAEKFERQVDASEDSWAWREYVDPFRDLLAEVERLQKALHREFHGDATPSETAAVLGIEFPPPYRPQIDLSSLTSTVLPSPKTKG